METLVADQKDKQTSMEGCAGKYLTVGIGGQSYGISVLKVREIMRVQPVTPVPQLPPEIKGVINLRGKIIPVVDLRTRFQMEHQGDERTECIVVTLIKTSKGSRHVGVIVDSVEEVTQVAEKDIEPAPDFGADISCEYILGMAKIKGKVKTLLDIDRVLSGEHIQAIEKL